jgi:hypothetical protein
VSNRALLSRAFPDNPRLRAEVQAALELVDSLNRDADALQEKLDALSAALGQGNYQLANDVLSSISNLANKTGAIVIDGGNADVRAIDGADNASIMSRGVGYKTFLALGGRGPSTSRPTPTADVAIIYFDTTLAAGGKPVFNYANTGWVDATGASV